MDGARVCHAKQKESVRERKMPCDLAHVSNLRDETDEHRGRERKIK